MSTSIRPSSCLKATLRQFRRRQQCRSLQQSRCLATGAAQFPPPSSFSQIPRPASYSEPGTYSCHPQTVHISILLTCAAGLRRIKTYPPPPSVTKHCPEPLVALRASQLSILDPTGARARLFSPTNPDAAKVGDILLVRLKNGDPFAGVCLNIRKAGVDTGILLRNELTRVGVEMWFKIYSPAVEGIEVVQRREKRARRARLYYMRYVMVYSMHEEHTVPRRADVDITDNQSMILEVCRILSGSTRGRGRSFGVGIHLGGMRTRTRRRTIAERGTTR